MQLFREVRNHDTQAVRKAKCSFLKLKQNVWDSVKQAFFYGWPCFPPGYSYPAQQHCTSHSNMPKPPPFLLQPNPDS
jgi:hypothetical protein